jgi:hypothetical protein
MKERMNLETADPAIPNEELLDQVNNLICKRCAYSFDSIARYVESNV